MENNERKASQSPVSRRGRVGFQTVKGLEKRPVMGVERWHSTIARVATATATRQVPVTQLATQCALVRVRKSEVSCRRL